jgi:hypothetical protein
MNTTKAPKTPYPIRLSDADRAAIEMIASHLGVSRQEAVRAAIQAMARHIIGSEADQA